MSGATLTSRGLKRRLLAQAVGDTFVDGPGAPLVFVWVLGAGTLVAVLERPLLALLLSGVLAVVGGCMTRDRVANHALRRETLRRLVERRVDTAQLADGALRDTVQRATGVFVDLALKILEIVDADGPRGELERVLADGWEMLALQFESARRVEEYRRVLALVRVHDADAPDGERLLRDQNLTAVERSAVEDEVLAATIGAKLETLMLQVLQVERRTGDLVKTAQCSEDASDTLRTLQGIVTARRETAETIRRMVSGRLG